MEVAIYAFAIVLIMAAMAALGAKMLHRAGRRMLKVCPSCQREVRATSYKCASCGHELARIQGKPSI
jgi:rRNA maturation endonuclease Nob1